MTDIIIRIERKRHDEQHWIRPGSPRGNSEQQYRVWFEGEDIGSWRVPECDAARWLLEHSKAQRDDTLRTFRGQTPSLIGKVGWFADRTVSESETPRFIKWSPMSEKARGVARGRAGPPSNDPEVE
jgi:hypothetical protein